MNDGSRNDRTAAVGGSGGSVRASLWRVAPPRAATRAERGAKGCHCVIWFPGAERSRYLHVTVAGEIGALTAETLTPLWGIFEGRLACLTITGIATRVGMFESLAPLSGITTLEDIRARYVAEADRVARISGTLVPETVTARHNVAKSWIAALRMTGKSDWDALVIAGRPRNRRDRVSVMAFAARGKSRSRPL